MPLIYRNSAQGNIRRLAERIGKDGGVGEENEDSDESTDHNIKGVSRGSAADTHTVPPHNPHVSDKRMLLDEGLELIPICRPQDF